MKFIEAVSAFTVIMTCICSSAAELSFTCEVSKVYDLDETGLLRQSPWQDQFRGARFSVSRISGEIIGEVIPTLMAEKTRVVHTGSSEYSFKTVAEFDNQIQVLEVQEFLTDTEKPFVALSMGGAGIVTGICK